MALSLMSPMYDTLLEHVDTTLSGMQNDDDLFGSVNDCKDKLLNMQKSRASTLLLQLSLILALNTQLLVTVAPALN